MVTSAKYSSVFMTKARANKVIEKYEYYCRKRIFVFI